MRRARHDRPNQILEKVEIIDAGSEGKAIARINDMVVFVPYVVPGDVVDIQVIRKKRSFIEGKAIRFHSQSEKNEQPFCDHFGTCGGCRWQNMKYADQLFYKQKQVFDSFTRIGKIEDPVILPILPSDKTVYYRNKLEYTFSNHRWFTDRNQIPDNVPGYSNALGFHLPQMFDRILDIEKCYLQDDISNRIRLKAKKYAIDHALSFYDVRKWEGFLRNLLIRNSNTGDVMAIFVFNYDDQEIIKNSSPETNYNHCLECGIDMDNY